MTTVLCTLYNSLYLDKGLVLYDSLCECAKDFKLYVLCMDDKCYEVLTDLKQEYHIPVRLADFEAGDTALLEAKGNRSMGEYCWTCSSSLIRYILQHFKEDNCTYIDADMCFYNNPQVLVDEMIAARKSVMVVPHRFPKGKDDLAKKVGNYCVEFNTFLNNKDSIEVLEYWRGKCLECCSNLGDGVHWGDQKYLDELVVKFNCVHVCNNDGAGVAPWNILLYNYIDSNCELEYIPKHKRTPVVFYHYQSIAYITRRTIDICLSKRVDKKIINSYYRPYLQRLENKKEMLSRKFGVSAIIYSHPAIPRRLSWIKRIFLGKLLVLIRRWKDGMRVVRI